MTLPKVLQKIRISLIGEKNLSIVVVDDGSTDKTSEVAIDSGANFVIRHEKNMGVAQAYRTAIRAGLKLDANVICTIDADGQFEPAEILGLVTPIREGRADLVLGSRFIHSKNGQRVPISKRVANRMLAFLVSMVIGKYICDTENGFRAISRKAAENLNLLGVVSFSSDMIIDVSKRGLRITEIPVSVKYFENRVSRVIKSFIKYGFRSLCLITMKLLSSWISFDCLTGHMPKVDILTPAKQKKISLLGSAIFSGEAVGIES